MARRDNNNNNVIPQMIQNPTDELNNNLGMLQAKANGLYAELGRLYFNEAKDNEGSEYSGIINEIKVVNTEIRDINSKIKLLHGIVECTNCGHDNPVSQTFCASCGTRLPHTQVNDGRVRCPKCGQVVEPGQRFCGVCGTKIEEQQDMQPSVEQFQEPAPQQAPEPVKEPQPVVETISFPQVNDTTPVMPIPETATTMEQPATYAEPQPINGKVCPTCGCVIEEPDALFCPECGTRL